MFCYHCGEELLANHTCRPPMTKAQAVAFIEGMLIEGLTAAMPDLEAQAASCAPGTVEADDCQMLIRIAKEMVQGMQADIALSNKLATAKKVVTLTDAEALRLVRTLRR